MDTAAGAGRKATEIAEPRDIVLVYFTLLADQTLPATHSKEFLVLELQSSGPSKQTRDDNRQHVGCRQASPLQDQFVLAALDKPWRFRTKWERCACDWLQKSCCVEVLSELLLGTQTPMGHLLAEKHGNTGGRRTSTLRSRTWAVCKYMSWLAGTFEVTFPKELAHVTEHFQVRRPEPCKPRSSNDPTKPW